jgi:hypothetical protein
MVDSALMDKHPAFSNHYKFYEYTPGEAQEHMSKNLKEQKDEDAQHNQDQGP